MILSDDVWSDIVYRPSVYRSISAINNGNFADRTISVLGLSKTVGTAGLRVGFAAAQNLDWLEEIAKTSAVDVTAQGVSTISQIAAQAAYVEGWECVVRRGFLAGCSRLLLFF